MKEILDVINLMVEGEGGGERKLFREHPHSTWDNYFSGYKIINFLGGNGF